MAQLSSPANLTSHSRTGTRIVRRTGQAPAIVRAPVRWPDAAAGTTAVPLQARPGRRWWDGRGAGAVIAVALAALAAAVLTIGIRTPWPWSDEGATFVAIQRSWEQLAVLWQSRDAPWVPYYYLAKAWATLLHLVAPALPTVIAVRLLSVAAAAATVVALYALVARNAGRVGGALAAVMLLSLPGFNRYAQEARGYTLLALAATLSWLLADRWLRPGRTATLTGSSVRLHREGPTGWFAPSAAGGGYAVSLAAVAAIHTFGVFQWPAHLVAIIAEPGGRWTRARRLGAFVVLALVALALAGAQLAESMLHGSGPTNPQAARVVTPIAVMTQLARGMSFTSHPGPSIAVLLLALVGVLSRVDGRRHVPLNLLIWLVTPLALEIGLGAVRTNLFRLRYWIALLPPLAALAGLGILALATATLRAVSRARRAPSGLARVLAGAVVAALLGVQVASVLAPQQQLRAVDGHGENLTQVAAIIAQARSAHPGLITAISSETGSGMIAAIDPGLLTQNPLRQLDGTVPSVYLAATPAHVVRKDLAGTHDVLWIHRGPETPSVAARHLPHVLAQFHPTVLWAKSGGVDWSLVLLRT